MSCCRLIFWNIFVQWSVHQCPNNRKNVDRDLHSDWRWLIMILPPGRRIQIQFQIQYVKIEKMVTYFWGKPHPFTWWKALNVWEWFSLKCKICVKLKVKPSWTESPQLSFSGNMDIIMKTKSTIIQTYFFSKFLAKRVWGGELTCICNTNTLKTKVWILIE